MQAAPTKEVRLLICGIAAAITHASAQYSGTECVNNGEIA